MINSNLRSHRNLIRINDRKNDIDIHRALQSDRHLDTKNNHRINGLKEYQFKDCITRLGLNTHLIIHCIRVSFKGNDQLIASLLI